MLLRAATFLLLLQLSHCSCPNYVSTRKSTCATIFERLQTELVGSDIDLYNLRKVFYPTSFTEPTVVNVSYHLTLTTRNDEACPDDSTTGVPALEQLINGTNVQEALNFVWTSKIFYTLFHPAMVNRMQPQLVENILSQLESQYSPAKTALRWDGVGSILTVEVLLTISLPCAPTLSALIYSLDDLTSLMKVYADSQENVSSWGSEEKGYSLNGGVVGPQWWTKVHSYYPYGGFLPTLNTVLSIILSLIVTFGIYYAIWGIAPSASGEKNFIFSHTFVWCGVAILLQLNVILFFFEIGNISKWCHYQYSCTDPAGLNKIIWLIWMTGYMLVAFVVMLVRYLRGKIRYMDLLIPEWRAFVVGIPPLSNIILLVAIVFWLLIRPLMKLRIVRNALLHIWERLVHCTRCPRPVVNVLQKGMKFLFVYILCMTIFLSVSLFSYSLIPILLQLFLYPFRVIAAYSFALTAFALFALTAFAATFLWKEQPPSTGKLVMYLSATTVAIVFILMIGTPFVPLYQLLVSGSFSDNPLVLAGASILPSLLLSSPIVWLFRNKLLPRFLEVDEDEEEEEEEEEEEKEKKKKKKKTKAKKNDDESEGKDDEEEDIEMRNRMDSTTELTSM